MAEVSLVPFLSSRGELAAPASTSIDDSFPDSVLADTVICPYNESVLAEKLIDAHAPELAAIIVEPVLGSMGMIPAEREFLEVLRAACDRHGIVLIFDEVITLRLSDGGAQKRLGVIPDLTCMGKIIGGGLPAGGVGGKASLMQFFSPDRKRPVMHASTFSGNALTMAAGLAAMRSYTASEAARLNTLGDRLRNGFNEVFDDAGVKIRALGCGSLTNLHFTADPVRDSRDAFEAIVSAGQLSSLLHLTMLRNGVMSATRLMYCTSTAMSEPDVDHAIEAMRRSLSELHPFMEEDWPNLIAS